ncbi:MAG: hypothetical protein JJ916_09215 [Phycisphaerales bacterium]|nr:hypothetical protein [Phycisphaerales bacterium]
MKRASALVIGMMALTAPAIAQHQLDAERPYEVQSGVLTASDGTFNYQGYLEVDGEAANGMYSFRFEAFNDPTGFDIAHELYFTSDLIPVVDGLFDLDVQMGGTASEARRFWREIGNQEMYFEIGVSEIEGGPYTTLGTRAKLGWSARAQYAGISDSLRFPYIDSFADPDGDPTTMIYLESDFGGSILELVTYTSTNEPMIDLTGPLPYGIDFGSQNGAIRIDDSDERVGLLSTANEFPIVGYLQNPEPGTGGAVLGQVATGAGEGYFAVSAINSNTGNRGYLGGENEAGLFVGDVLVNGNINKSYGNASQASAAPVAYGFINSSGSVASGSGNFTCTWESSLLRYRIAIENENYFFSNYTAVITPSASSNPRLVSTSSATGELLVYILDPLSGYARTQSSFQFVVYKSDPNTTVINRNTTGMDDSEFYRLHGLTPEVVRTQQRTRPSVAGEGITEAR